MSNWLRLGWREELVEGRKFFKSTENGLLLWLDVDESEAGENLLRVQKNDGEQFALPAGILIELMGARRLRRAKAQTQLDILRRWVSAETKRCKLRRSAAHLMRCYLSASGKPLDYELSTELAVAEGAAGVADWWNEVTEERCAAMILSDAFERGFEDRWDISGDTVDECRRLLFPSLVTDEARCICEKMIAAAVSLDGAECRRLSESLGPSDDWAKEAEP